MPRGVSRYACMCAIVTLYWLGIFCSGTSPAVATAAAVGNSMPAKVRNAPRQIGDKGISVR